MNTHEHGGELPPNEDRHMTAQHAPAMNIRMSRISHPRATWFAILLLVVVFLGFGLWAEASLPQAQTAAPIVESHLAMNYPWLGKLTTLWGS